MKQTVYGIILAIIFIITLACNMTVSGRNVRQNELDQALNRGIKQAVETLVDSAVSNEELAADLAEGILTGIESDADIKIDVIACDASKGILSVKATAFYKHINGKKGTVTAERTVILEEYLP